MHVIRACVKIRHVVESNFKYPTLTRIHTTDLFEIHVFILISGPHFCTLLCSHFPLFQRMNGGSQNVPFLHPWLIWYNAWNSAVPGTLPATPSITSMSKPFIKISLMITSHVVLYTNSVATNNCMVHRKRRNIIESWTILQSYMNVTMLIFRCIQI